MSKTMQFNHQASSTSGVVHNSNKRGTKRGTQVRLQCRAAVDSTGYAPEGDTNCSRCVARAAKLAPATTKAVPLVRTKKVTATARKLAQRGTSAFHPETVMYGLLRSTAMENGLITEDTEVIFQKYMNRLGPAGIVKLVADNYARQNKKRTSLKARVQK